MYGEMSEQQQYFHETAWSFLQECLAFHQQGRIARAQHALQEARYFAYKVPAEFIEPELSENLDRITKLLSRGYV